MIDQNAEFIHTEVYAAKNKNPKIIRNSSSGGMFTALSDLFIKNGDAIASCIYNVKTDCVELSIYDDCKTRDMARGSKYIQAQIGDGFKRIKEWLQDNSDKSLLVIGTGCQIAGLDKYLRLINLRERVVLVDLICHGATSPGLWKDYIEHIGISGKIEYLSFKDKRNGWHNPTVYAKVNGEEISINEYSEWFYGQWAIRKSCYKCPYTKVNRTTSDLTIGDYWGIENVIPDFADSMGVSLVLLHTTKGKKIFDDIKNVIDIRESNDTDCLQPRLISPAEMPKNREKFWDDMRDKGINYCSKKYMEKQENVLWRRATRKVKCFLKSLLGK